ncbi:MAG: STAS domain-containing protein [Candidatus Tectomicrobia bacterium]|uniref:Anti-sigma factor antagonist n=1 Tax=Tectimicrobiota bacterium TaxID=2528274 RepID=A0A937W198_UNCTE|nr:STAS domain-containing protein [Candidatus Tectomicrobia bacterium]
MHVTIETPQAGVTVMRPQGTLDMNSVPAFRHTLEAEVQRAGRGVIVALSEVTFMDSAGIAVLIEGFKWSRSRSLPYILSQLTPAVQMVIELARLEQFFTIVASVEEGLARLPSPA